MGSLELTGIERGFWRESVKAGTGAGIRAFLPAAKNYDGSENGSVRNGEKMRKFKGWGVERAKLKGKTG